jgi:hypothetical protein
MSFFMGCISYSAWRDTSIGAASEQTQTAYCTEMAIRRIISAFFGSFMFGAPAFPASRDTHADYPGAHAAAVSAGIHASHRLYGWLGSATDPGDSFPLMDGGRLPADRIFRAALTSRS